MNRRRLPFSLLISNSLLPSSVRQCGDMPADGSPGPEGAVLLERDRVVHFRGRLRRLLRSLLWRSERSRPAAEAPRA